MEGALGRNATPAAGAEYDQARTGPFRVLMAVQVLAASFFGLFPLLAPAEFARVFQLRGDEPYLYRLAGSAAAGYAAVALVGVWRPRWAELRIPLVATFTFTGAAFAACLLSLDESGLQPLAALVGVASAVFVAIAAFWLVRDAGPRDAGGESLETGFRLTLALATLSAATFGILPLLLPRTFTSFFELSAADLVIVRLAGAACFGYAVAGMLELRVDRWPAIRLQNIAAIAFNALAAISSAIYLATGGRSILGVLILAAAGFFTFALTWWAARAAR